MSDAASRPDSSAHPDAASNRSASAASPSALPFDISQVSGLGPFTVHTEPVPSASAHSSKPAPSVTRTPQRPRPVATRTLYRKGAKAFLVVNAHTLEVRTDPHLRDLLVAKYESVMPSRYFGRGGLEIVPAGQLTPAELADLIRLSYNLTPA